MSTILRSIAFSLALLMAAAIGYANDDPTELGDDKNNALELPEQSSLPVDREINDDVQFIYIHNNRGEAGLTVDFIHLTLKGPLPGPMAARMKFQGAKKRIGDQWVDVVIEESVRPSTADAIIGEIDDSEKAEGDEPRDRVSFALDQPLDDCEKVRLRVKLQYRDNTDSDWGSLKGTYASLNVSMAAASRNNVVRPQLGQLPEPLGEESWSIEPAPLELDKSATPGVQQAPDLFYGEANNCKVEPGVIEFVPLADAAFEDPPSGELEVLVFDSNENEITDPERVEIGNVSIEDGRAYVDVLYRDPEEPSGVVFVLHNAYVNVPSMESDQEIGYTTGGTATRGYRSRVIPLANTGEPAHKVTFDRASAKVNGGPDPSYVELSGQTSVVQVEDVLVQGYVPGFVLREPVANVIGDGTIEIRPLDDFEIVHDPSTEVFFLDASTDDTVGDAFGSVSIETTPEGGAKVTLANRQATEIQLKIVVANINVDLGEGPFSFHENARLGIGGTALPNVLNDALIIAEGSPLPEGHEPKELANQPLQFVDWISAASFD